VLGTLVPAKYHAGEVVPELIDPENNFGRYRV
jgi:hypothetical protein